MDNTRATYMFDSYLIKHENALLHSTLYIFASWWAKWRVLLLIFVARSCFSSSHVELSQQIDTKWSIRLMALQHLTAAFVDLP